MGRINHIFLLLTLTLVVITGFRALDHLTQPEPRVERSSTQDADATQIEHAGRPRAFFFLVDSLRAETASDSDLMPTLHALQSRSTHAQVVSSRDAVTVSAIRAMFTGRDRFSILGFVKNFAKGREDVESLFTQLRQAGARVAVYSDGSFTQFGQDIPVRHVHAHTGAGETADQNAAIDAALTAYSSGEYDLVVVHINYSDHAAHKYGVGAPEYNQTFAAVDEIIRRLDDAIPKGEALVIAGDHGHTEDGRHAMGLDIPTVALYRGAAFTPGLDAGTISIIGHRYFLSWALAQPLAKNYRGPRYPEALRSPAALPEAYAREVKIPIDRSGKALRPPSPSHQLGFWLLGVCLGMIAASWLGLALQLWRRPHRQVASLVIGLTLLNGLPTSLLWGGGAAIVMAAFFIAEAREKNPRQTTALIGLIIVSGVGLHLWGRLLAIVREPLHEPSMVTLAALTVGLFIAAAFSARRVGAMKSTWALIAAPALLLYPTTYRYGALGFMATAWTVWLIATLSARREKNTHRDFFYIGAIFLLLQTFGISEGNNFQLERWFSWIEPLTPSSPMSWLLVSLGAKSILFLRPDSTKRTRSLEILAILGLTAILWGWWTPSPGVTSVIIVGSLASGAWAVRCSRTDGEGLRRVMWLAGLFLAYYATVRVAWIRYVWADLLFAALLLSARWAKHLEERERQGAYALLISLGFVVGGWVTLGWTLHDLEWFFIYDWFEAAFVEEQVAYFMPLIALKYLFPLWIVRYLLGETLGYDKKTRRLAVGIIGGKIFCTLLITTGLGYYLSDSDVYLEAAQECSLMAILVLAL